MRVLARRLFVVSLVVIVGVGFGAYCGAQIQRTFGISAGHQALMSARLHFRVGKATEALEILRAALDDPQTEARARLLLGRFLFEIGEVNDAVSQIRYAIHLGLNARDRRMARVVLSEIVRTHPALVAKTDPAKAPKPEEKYWGVTGTASMDWIDGLARDASAHPKYVPRRVSDRRVTSSGGLFVTFPLELPEDRGRTRFKAGYGVSQQTYLDYKDSDFQSHKLYVQARRRFTKDFSGSLGYDFAFNRAGREFDALSTTHHVGGNLSLVEYRDPDGWGALFGRIAVDYTDIEIKNSLLADAGVVGLTVSQTWGFPRRTDYLGASITGSDTNARGLQYENESHSFRLFGGIGLKTLGLDIPGLERTGYFKFGGGYRITRHDGLDGVEYGTKRKDKIYSADVKFVQPVFDELEFFVKGTYKANHSTLMRHDYVLTVVSGGAQVRF